MTAGTMHETSHRVDMLAIRGLEHTSISYFPLIYGILLPLALGTIQEAVEAVGGLMWRLPPFNAS